MKNLIYLLIFFFFLIDSSSASGRPIFPQRGDSNNNLYTLVNSAVISLSKYKIIDKEYLGSDSVENDKDRFKFGLRDEFLLMFASIADEGNTIKSSSSIFNFHFTFGLEIPDNNRVYFQIGYSYIYEDFSGADLGIFFQANLYKGVYGLIGIDYFNNSGFEHGVSRSDHKGFILYCLGAGYQLSVHFNMDLIFSVPNDKVFGNDLVSDNDYFRINKVNNGILRFGIEYIF